MSTNNEKSNVFLGVLPDLSDLDNLDFYTPDDDTATELRSNCKIVTGRSIMPALAGSVIVNLTNGFSSTNAYRVQLTSEGIVLGQACNQDYLTVQRNSATSFTIKRCGAGFTSFYISWLAIGY